MTDIIIAFLKDFDAVAPINIPSKINAGKDISGIITIQSIRGLASFITSLLLVKSWIKLLPKKK